MAHSIQAHHNGRMGRNGRRSAKKEECRNVMASFFFGQKSNKHRAGGNGEEKKNELGSPQFNPSFDYSLEIN